MGQNEKKVLIFAGTTEGRKLTAFLAKNNVPVHVCTATSYGESLLSGGDRVTVSHDRMNVQEMKELMEQYGSYCVIDATHPYAKEVTKNIKDACRQCRILYRRLLRGRTTGLPDPGQEAEIFYVENIRQAVGLLRKTTGNILVTTGSKELDAYTEIEDYSDRVYARVLSVTASVEKCEELGIRGRHLICMQGPFSVEMNRMLLKEYDISWLVTKESGAEGGYPEKYEAVLAEGARMVVIGRPEESGDSYEEIIQFLKKELDLHNKRKVSIVGIGTGAETTFTAEAKERCETADLLIGAARMIDAVKNAGIPSYISYRPEEIAAYIGAHPEYERIAILFSGDPGFYSGAVRMQETLAKMQKSGEPMEIEVLPGISSITYFSARLGVSWEDAELLSVHGKKENVIAAVRRAKKVFVLVGSDTDIREICTSMTETGFGDLTVCIGSRFSYREETIQRGTAKDYTGYEGEGLAVLYIEHPQAGSWPVTPGIPDHQFVRGNVPMTKEEVRSVSLSKLRIKKTDVIYDIGAGTGSVSVEAALLAEAGRVYAVERQEEAVGLIRENAKKMKVCNLQIVKGEAPEALAGLPAPDCVFIGGSGGHLEEIVEIVRKKNPSVRLVISAITLETLARAVECMKKIPKAETEEVVQISVARSRQVGAYHMMTGQNPVYLISCTCCEERED